MGKLNLSAPWTDFYREIQALFKDDPDIQLAYDEDNYVVKMFVEGEEKADALSKLMPSERAFGNVILRVQVIPANENEVSRVELFQKAFKGNTVFSYAKTTELTPMSFGASYVVFKNKVVQYFNDDLSDVNGLRSTLYQDIAVVKRSQGRYHRVGCQRTLDAPELYLQSDVAVHRQAVPPNVNPVLFLAETKQRRGRYKVDGHHHGGEQLHRRGVAIRDCSNYPGLGEGWYRIAVRQREENDMLMAAIREAAGRDTPWQ